MEASFGTRLDASPESDVFLTSMYGLNTQLKRFFPDRKVRVIQTAGGSTGWRDIVEKDKNITYPFFAVWPASVEQNVTGYNSFALRKRGVLGPKLSNTGRDSKQTVYSVYHLSPATLILNVLFTTNNVKDLYFFIPRWLTAARFHFLNFDIIPESRDNAIKIKVDMDTSLQFPEIELDSGQGELFNLQVSCTLSTYHGSIQKRLTLSGVNYNFQNVNTDISGNSSLLEVIQKFTGLATNS